MLHQLTASTLPGLIPKAANLASDPAILRSGFDTFSQLAMNLAGGLLILVVTFWASGWLSKVAGRSVARMNRHHVEDKTLEGFVSSLVRYAVIIIGLVAVLQQLGVRATSIIAVLGAASLAVGLALQGALSSVAAGVMLLIFRPYRVGEFVEIAGKSGTVRKLDLFTTEMSSPDNLRVVVPNSKAFGEIVTNYSRPENRRIELNFGIDYADSLDTALDLLKVCAAEDRRVLKDPAPWSKVTALADSSVTVTVRAWSTPADYWETRFDLIKRVKERFEAAGLSFPYPHQVALSWDDAQPAAQRRDVQRQVSRQ